MGDATVLIVSTEPLIAALLGVLVELDGHRPAFHEGEEPPQAAVDHYHPRAIFVDVDHRDGCSEAFLERQRRAGIRVVLFSPRRTPEEVEEVATRWSLPWVAMPVSMERFSSTLAGALSG